MKFFYRSNFPVAVLSILFLTAAVSAQSTSQSFPTPISSAEISGAIRPRDVGDARLTSYYYQFDAEQGDLFVNIVTRNFTGDIDIFTQNGLRPLTKITFYADFADSETGRVIYLRKPEKMILRIQGRTPGDDPATFRIKFAGSFVASSQVEPAGEPALPTLTAKNESGIRVNSVGTILEIVPKATPTPAAVESHVVEERSSVPESETKQDRADSVSEKNSDEKPGDPTLAEPVKKMGVIVTDGIPEKTDPASATPTAGRRARGRRPPARRTSPAEPSAAATPPESPAETPVKTAPPTGRRGRTPPRSSASKEPDPLASVNLVIVFKDGRTIERPMSEVLRFTVDKGVLTVISTDGSIGRYSILDVAKVTIQ